MSDLKNKVETLLFMAKMPLTAADLAEVLKEDKKLIEPCLEALVTEYASRTLQIVRVAGGYQMATRPEYHDIVERFVKSPIEVTLSTAAMETLAIIAYRQPIARREIEHIRGVNSDAVVKSLMDKGLVRELGKGDLPGKPMVIGTTELFLRHFGLNDIKDLPPDPGMNYQLPLQRKQAVVS
jgi:segregation and condensation protein B